MTVLNEKFELNNGVDIPKLGLGTWLINDSQVASVVKSAIADGYRHIDTAEAYDNEHGVGLGVRDSGVRRADLFVTTKLAAEHKNYHEAKVAVDDALHLLQLDYLDLMLIHSPEPWTQFRAGDRYFAGNLEAWRALSEAQQAGKIRAIGVSNFEIPDLQNIIDNGDAPIQVNQVLAHIGHVPNEIMKFDQAHDILTEAYSPVAHGAILHDAKIEAIAAHYQVSLPQLAIRYCLQLGLLPLPKSQNPTHIRSNAAIDFTISAADMAVLDTIKMTNYGSAGDFPVYRAK